MKILYLIVILCLILAVSARIIEPQTSIIYRNLSPSTTYYLKIDVNTPGNTVFVRYVGFHRDNNAIDGAYDYLDVKVASNKDAIHSIEIKNTNLLSDIDVDINLHSEGQYYGIILLLAIVLFIIVAPLCIIIFCILTCIDCVRENCFPRQHERYVEMVTM